MSFFVKALSSLDELWEHRNRLLEKKAGKSNYAVCGNGEREQAWITETFEEALLLKKKLEKVPGVHVTIQEYMSQPHRKGKK